MSDIPFFNYPALYKRFETDFDRIFKAVCSKGAFILQQELEQFEQNLASFLNTKHAFGVADGTNAMVIGLQAAGIKAGDEIIITSHTYIATAAAINMVGAVPIFADIGDDYMMSPISVSKKITSKTKAIMPTQLNGRCCDMDQLQTIADQHGLQIFEDSAQGLGAKYKGRSAGTFGTFGTLSFYPAKVMGCFGDGGAVMTNDPEIAEKLLLLRDHGRDPEGEVVAWGTNSRLDNLQAAFLDFLLTHYHTDMARRREIAGKYEVAFRPHAMLHPPKGPDNGDHFDIYQNYELAVENRDELKQHLENNGIRSIVQWNGTPVHHFDSLGFGKEKFIDLPKTDWFFERCLMLPMNMSITDAEVDRVISTILNFYDK